MSKSGNDKVKPFRRTTGLFVNLLLILLSLVFAALLAEGLARAFFNEPIQPRFFVDSGYGVRGVKANIDTRHYVPGDYDVRVRTNSVGMRGRREYSVEPPPGVRRVLIVGDSMGFGFGVEDDEAVSAVLEKLLNARGDPVRWEVINQSVSGTGQAEQLVTYHTFGRNYRPNTVVLLYFGNDIVNNQVSGLYAAIGDSAVRRTGASYLPAVRAQEMLYAVPPIRWLFEHSAAWNILRNRLSSLVQRELWTRQGMNSANDLQPRVVALTRALIRQFVADVKADGGNVTIAAIPNVREKMSTNFPLNSVELSDLDVTFVDGRTFLVPADFFKRDLHLRAVGHAKLAKQLAAAIPPLKAQFPAAGMTAAGPN